VRELKRKYPSLSAIVIGSDNLKDIGKWRDFEKLDAQMEWIVVGRGEVAGHELERLGRYRYIEMDMPVSSTRIRAGGGREYLDKRLAAEIEEYYKNDSGENI
jgi:nicotinate-nucleotide adenylyltransferase